MKSVLQDRPRLSRVGSPTGDPCHNSLVIQANTLHCFQQASTEDEDGPGGCRHLTAVAQHSNKIQAGLHAADWLAATPSRASWQASTVLEAASLVNPADIARHDVKVTQLDLLGACHQYYRGDHQIFLHVVIIKIISATTLHRQHEFS